MAQPRRKKTRRCGILVPLDSAIVESAVNGSSAVRLSGPYGNGLRPELKHGFIYSDCRVDDARLVVANAMDARQHGARVLTGVECVTAKRLNDGWHARLSNGEEISARLVVFANGLTENGETS